MSVQGATSPQGKASLRGKVALVTGSTSGIGLAIARALAAEGADLMLNGFGDPAAIESIRTGIAADHGVRVLHDGADVSKPAPIHAMIARTEAELGRLDVLVNNAGIQHVAPIVDFPPDRWDAIIAINLSSAFPRHAGGHPRHEDPGVGDASSTSRPPTVWSAVPKNQPMSPPSTASSALPKLPRSNSPTPASRAMQFARAGF